MGVLEKAPLLPSNESDDGNDEKLSRDNKNSGGSKLQFVAGLLAALGWISFSALSAICVQVC